MKYRRDALLANPVNVKFVERGERIKALETALRELVLENLHAHWLDIKSERVYRVKKFSVMIPSETLTRHAELLKGL